MIIAFGYKARSGKDTAASFLEQAGWRRASFATALKAAAGCIFEFTSEQMYGDLKEVLDAFWGITPRTGLQDLGDGVRRLFGPDVWIRALHRHMQKFGHVERWVISDVRYKNEAEWVKSVGGIVVRLDREGSGAGPHASETELDTYQGWDHVIDNNGSLEDLRHAVCRL